MGDTEITSLETFWPYYVREHARPATRQFHFAGTSLALLSLLKFAATRRPRFLGQALLAGYGLAWLSHLVIEKNRPATFKYPLFSLLSDFRMYGLMWAGRMDEEVARCCALPAEVE